MGFCGGYRAYRPWWIDSHRVLLLGAKDLPSNVRGVII